MSLKDLPEIQMLARPGAHGEVSTLAAQRWNPNLRAGPDEDVATISILDPIGQDWMGEGVTSKRIAGALRQIGPNPVVVNINSPGGDFFEGLSIYNLLREHPAQVTVHILGLAASAASVIAMAGDRVLIGRAAFLMIHNTWVCACGDRNAMREVADWLEPFDAASVDLYVARTGMDASAIRAMLDKETWIGGAKAVDDGFADELLPSDAVRDEPVQSGGDLPSQCRQLDLLLSRAGLSVSARRETMKNLTSGMPSAARTGMPSAADTAGLNDVLAVLKSF